MYKPSYIVVTSVLVFLAILAFARQLLVGFLPPAASNRLAGSRQRFLSSAGHYPINWNTIEENAFSRAQTSGKPILLVIGIHGGRLTHDFDTAIFADNDTVEYVEQNYFSIRIDGYEHPEWLQAILPISRLKLGLFPGFQAWVLDSAGHVLSFIGHTSSSTPIDNRDLFQQLVQARKVFDDLKNVSVGFQATKDRQRVDLDLIGSQTGEGTPSFSAYMTQLADQCDYAHGGFPRGDIQGLFPNAWRFLTLTGNSKLWQASLEPLMFSPLMDIQDGGFFRLANSANLTGIEFDKASRQNSEMMLTLAIQGQVDGDRFYQSIAESTFDWLIAMANRNHMIPACQEDDETPQGRSPRLCFPSWKLREALNPDDRDWASAQLGLNPSQNAQMVPFVHSRNTILDLGGRYSRILSQLRAKSRMLPRLSDKGYLDVNGHTLARMLEVYRIWGEPSRLQSLAPLLTGLDAFRVGNYLTHRIDDSTHRRGYLGDYLGYSDAKLQEYLATGNVTAFQKGLHFMEIALSLFRGDRDGQFDLSASQFEMGGFDSFCVPDLGDDLGESCTAQAIRLLLAYGRLLGDSKGGVSYLNLAKKSTRLFADVASSGGPSAGGYFCAAAEVLDDVYAIAVGPRAPDFANILYRRIPTRFIAPAVGGIRRDIQQRGPGIYIVGKTIEGPFTVEQAAQRLPTTLVSRTSW